MKNDRLINALLRKPVDRTPIWLMRQAGRYLPEYRALRSQVKDFYALCQMPELACEITLQPIRRFPLDAAIIFSDILTVPMAMGCDIHLEESKGPVILNPVQSLSAIDTLQTEGALEKLNYVMQAICYTKKALDNTIPLIGFAGSPWTVATYMVEGCSSKLFQIIKTMLYREPQMLHRLLQKITEVTVDYLNAQITAGADVLMVFDTWGGVLSFEDFAPFSLNYLKQIASRLNLVQRDKKIPLIFFSKNCGLQLEAIADSGCDAVGLDWTVDLTAVKKTIGKKVALQGNLDPILLFAAPEKIHRMTKELLDVYRDETGYVFNLGHGILPQTPVEHVQALVETVINVK